MWLEAAIACRHCGSRGLGRLAKRLDSVLKQVEQDLLQTVALGHHRQLRRRGVANQGDAPFANARPDEQKRSLDRGLHADRDGLGPGLA